MKKISNFKLSLINIFIIVILVGILFLTLQFFIHKQKIENFEEQCPDNSDEKCIQCGEDGNNDNDKSKMTPFGYKDTSNSTKSAKGTCNNDSKNKK